MAKFSSELHSQVIKIDECILVLFLWGVQHKTHSLGKELWWHEATFVSCYRGWNSTWCNLDSPGGFLRLTVPHGISLTASTVACSLHPPPPAHSCPRICGVGLIREFAVVSFSSSTKRILLQPNLWMWSTVVLREVFFLYEGKKMCLCDALILWESGPYSPLPCTLCRHVHLCKVGVECYHSEWIAFYTHSAQG